MKPIYIRMQAFGSYQDECISFEKVNHGLFLITGDTGAGKTTIFDAITFALYGKTSGGKRDGKMMCSQYAPGGRKTEVEFKFEYRGEKYTVTRRPEQANWKKKKDEAGREYYEQLATPLKPTAELIMPDGSVYPGKIKDINYKIEEIIGLNAEQFTQIAMLAQGDFMKLLHASSEERKAIFAKIFDTKLYELIETEIAKRAKTINIQLANNKNDIKKEFDRIKCVEGSRYTEEWSSEKYQEKFSESDKDSLLELISDICGEGVEKQKEIEKKKADTEKKINHIDAAIQMANTVNKYFHDLKEWKKKEEKLQEKTQYISGLNDKIEEGKRALEVKKDYDALEQKKNETDACRKRIEALASWIQENQEKLDKLRIQSEGAGEKYDKESPQLHADIKNISEGLDKYEELENLVKNQTEMENRINQSDSRLQELQEKKAECGEELEKLSEDIEKLKKKTGNMEALEKEIEITENKKKDLEAVRQHILNLENSNREWKLKEKEYHKAEKNEELRQKEYEILYEKFVSSQAAIIRAGLKPGEPCPVCGSVHHNNDRTAIQEWKDIIDDKALKREKTKLDKAAEAKKSAYREMQDRLSEKNSILGILNDSCHKIYGNDVFFEEAVRDRLEADYKNISVELEKKYNFQEEAVKNNEFIQKNEKIVKDLTDKIDFYTDSIKKENEAINDLKVEKSGCDAGIKGLREQLIYPDKKQAGAVLEKKRSVLEKLKEAAAGSAEKYQAFEKETSEKTGQLLSEKENLKRNEEAFHEAKNKYEESLRTQGFDSTEAFRMAFLKKEEIEAFQMEIENYRTDMAVAHDNTGRLKKETEGKKIVDVKQYEEEKRELKNYKTILEKETKVIFNIVSVNKEAYKNGCTLYEQREKMQKTAAILNNLDSTANGKISGKHINFQTYIQRRYFKQIIDRANKRLYKMSGNQFILQCRDVKNLGAQGQVGLDLDVYSIVNDQTRDVKTLSGGESFMAALSMALGMADIIQNSRGSIHIDTMFIDEGFGSLSEETRNKAINILNELSEGKRLVGIISHVSELKSQV